MVYERDQIEFAMCGVRLLSIVAVVAIGSYVAKSRIAFLLGSAGAFVGLDVPQQRAACTLYRSVEAAYLGYLEDSANHVLFFGIIGASIGWGLGIYLAGNRPTMVNETNLHGETTQSDYLGKETPVDAKPLHPQGGSPPGGAGPGRVVN